MAEHDTVFFRPLWRRILLVVVVASWSAFEWWNGNSFWGTLTAGAAAYAVWSYLIAFPDAGEGLKKE